MHGSFRAVFCLSVQEAVVVGACVPGMGPFVWRRCCVATVFRFVLRTRLCDRCCGAWSCCVPTRLLHWYLPVRLSPLTAGGYMGDTTVTVPKQGDYNCIIHHTPRILSAQNHCIPNICPGHIHMCQHAATTRHCCLWSILTSLCRPQ